MKSSYLIVIGLIVLFYAHSRGYLGLQSDRGAETPALIIPKVPETTDVIPEHIIRTDVV